MMPNGVSCILITSSFLMCSDPATEMSLLPVFMVNFIFDTIFLAYAALSVTFLRKSIFAVSIALSLLAFLPWELPAAVVVVFLISAPSLVTAFFVPHDVVSAAIVNAAPRIVNLPYFLIFPLGYISCI